ncbi:ABC transporter ATP-binding protein [Streptomyces sp. XM4193]|uniref:ABC transporter ATP-binding protein n=1 Tax=Streptomyces sp. XM4193 TaxID=2929782 RepID=UPI001FFB05DA|nr:ABC transporter ATP-binding protein [Streptomyces sp. XM4193]MCK1796861.1 ABC transporter ATP-binding protein [Streptomyces sp. XM4193]
MSVEPSAPAGSLRPALHAEALRKTFFAGTPREFAVLRGVSLTVERGRICTILGPSGSGKTTLLRCLSGLESVDSGTVEVGGTKVHELSPRETQRFRREDIAFVFQEYNLISDLTLRENVELDRPMAARPAELAARWRLEHVLDHFPDQCSGGQQQKAAILRALNRDVDVLFCDEPTGALDGTSAGEVLSVLQEVSANGVTVVMITHNEMVTEISDRVVRLHDGEVVSDTVVPDPRPAGELEW